MNHKCKLIGRTAGCMLLTILVIGGTAGLCSCIKENGKQAANNQAADSDKHAAYSDYIVKTLVSTLKDNFGLLDCEVEIDGSKDEIAAVSVRIISEDNNRTSIPETDILNYISKFLGVPENKIALTIY